MFWFKHCPRCSGDLFEDRDQYGPFITCMQCGFTKDVARQDGDLIVIAAEPVAAPVASPTDAKKRRRISHGGRHFSKTIDCDSEAVTETAA